MDISKTKRGKDQYNVEEKHKCNSYTSKSYRQEIGEIGEKNEDR